MIKAPFRLLTTALGALMNRSIFRPFILPGTMLLLLAFVPVCARATYTLTVEQIGGSVVVEGSGTLNISALTLEGAATAGGGIVPKFAGLAGGSGAGDTLYYYGGGGLTGPTSFGTGGTTLPSSGSGRVIQISGIGKELYVPSNYVSGTYLTDSSTYLGDTFAILGFTPGTYTYTWGTGATADSLIVTSVIPEPSTWAVLLAGAGLLGLTWLRRRVRIA